VNLRTKQEYIERYYSHLAGNSITLSEASEKYAIPRSTLEKWFYKQYIRVVSDSYPVQCNEADIAYCVDVYQSRRKRGIRYGAPLLDDAGAPYELKHPDLSKKRKQDK